MEKEISKFYKFRELAMINTFGIRSITDCPELNNWLNTDDSVTAFEEMNLDLALKRFAELGKAWNEEELKMHRIGGPIYQYHF